MGAINVMMVLLVLDTSHYSYRTSVNAQFVIMFIWCSASRFSMDKFLQALKEEMEANKDMFGGDGGDVSAHEN